VPLPHLRRAAREGASAGRGALHSGAAGGRRHRGGPAGDPGARESLSGRRRRFESASWASSRNAA
jgi:hypothetical protein